MKFNYKLFLYHSTIGFACFVYLIGFLILVVAAVMISPLIMGSSNEHKMVSSPQEIDAGYISESVDKTLPV